MKIGGRFGIEQYRGGVLIARHLAKNGVTTEGLNDILGAAFRNQTQHSNWYFGLIDGAVAPTLAAADTMSAHAGWSENVDYDEVARQSWTPVQSGDGKIVNTTYPTYTSNAVGVIAGVFIVSDDTKSGTAGVLWSTGTFENGNASLGIGDIFKPYYELTATGS